MYILFVEKLSVYKALGFAILVIKYLHRMFLCLSEKESIPECLFLAL